MREEVIHNGSMLAMCYTKCMLLPLGILAVLLSAGLLVTRTVRAPRLRPYPLYGWAGVSGIVLFETLLALRVPWVVTYFTELIWPVYILAMDGAVFRVRGDSPLHAPGRLIANYLLSIPAWILFEAYNFKLANWIYVGVPDQWWVFVLAGSWAFGTIYPGVFETAELLYATGGRERRCRPLRFSAMGKGGFVVAGAVLLLFPLLAPSVLAPYLFGAIWVGFIFFLDPINQRLGLASLLTDLEQGRPGRLYSLLLSGVCCGFFWEFWNFWAGGRWVYVFPILHRFRIFAMPFPGFLGFPPFVVECFTMTVLLSWALYPQGMRPVLMEGRSYASNPEPDKKAVTTRS